ncbi:cysteine hydrolase family protein [Chromobacterium alticapitis]|uniref:Cysteine hydrolase n=1 Tax=Chromobacterium alticapitis TaxID=2073169 RepID=A0A2S5DC22_9NEIS|nr:cysteine hydrolase family protein [Chromobacterium alticapitis]POZ60584.1 cysteine hydrolase [Chromobacterium alticapitis]
MSSFSFRAPLLLLIDMQQAVDDPCWGPRNHPQAEQVCASLLAAWRELGLPLIHIRHDSTELDSTFRPDRPGNAFKPETMPLPSEMVMVKQTNSAFIGTELESLLRERGWLELVVAGVSTSNSVEATVRMAGNLGFNVWLAEDGCFTFDKTDWQGRLRSAEEVHAMSLANLDGEYCRVCASEDILSALGNIAAAAHRA